eukprot:459564-Pyramimonas_sp.AAC.1
MSLQISEERQQRIARTISKWGYEPHFFSVATGAGLREVAELLQNQTTVIAGPSGVGKSSVINRLQAYYNQMILEDPPTLGSDESKEPGATIDWGEVDADWDDFD